ncbi:DUF1616 domain-containing protein [Candidatus Altiarchaeota archaeon]
MNVRESFRSRERKLLMAFIVAFILFSLFLYLLEGISPLKSIAVVLSLVFLFFLPGYSVIWALFIGNREIDFSERLALSFGLSIILIVLGVLVGHQVFRVPYTSQGVALVVAALIILPVILRVIWKLGEYALHRTVERI